MKFSNLFMMGLLSTCVFTSCNDNDDNSVWGNSEDVVFYSHIKSTASRVTGTAWDNGDEIGIFMQTQNSEFANKKYLAQTDGALTPAPGNVLRYPSEGTSSFLAYYPFNASLSDKNVSLSVADQSNPSKVDFLYSNNASNIKNGEAATLAFSHQLSKVVINVKGDETIATTKGLAVTLSGLNTSATFNLADGKLTPADSKADIKLNVNAEGTMAEAILLPTATTEGATMTFTLEGKNYVWTVTTPENKGFEAGFKYTYNANLSDTNGQPSIKMGNATITDWTEKAGGDIDINFGGGEDKPVVSNVLLEENFDANQGKFTIKDITLPTGSTYVWKWDNYKENNFMKASAFIKSAGGAQNAESWLVSPALAIPAEGKVTLTLNHGHNFGKELATEMSLWAAVEGTEITNAATGWTKLDIADYGAGKFAYVSTDIDLAAFAGKKIQIAFRYLSTTANAPTWQINSVKVFTGEGGEGGVTPNPNPDPEPTPTPGVETVLFEETFGTPAKSGSYWPGVEKYTGWTDTHNMTYSDPIMAASYSNASVRSTSTLDGHVWFAAKGSSTTKHYDSALKIAGFNTNGYQTITLTYDIAANAAGDQNVITVKTDKENLAVPSVPITTTNKYQTVTLNLQAGFTYIQFTSLETANSAGYRLDNVKVVAK